MSIALYRKYRPKEFSEIVGQKYIVKAITNAIENNKISHAYLFTGPRGVGKTSMARLIAKAINGDNQQNILEIENGQHVDVIEIDAASNRGVDEIRNIKEKIQYMPLKGKMKIYIIDEVHMLTNEAFNALLKTLEEPPSHSLFILATTESEKLPLTVISRCQRYDFTPITLNELVELFKKVSKNENVDIDDESLELIFEKSEGSVRDAFSIYEKLIDSLANEKITKQKTEEILGFIPNSYYEEFLNLLDNKKSKDVIVFVDDLWKQGIDIEKFLKGFAKYLSKYEDKYVNYIYTIYDNLFKFRYEEDKRLLIYLILKELLFQKNEVKLEKTEKIKVVKSDHYYQLNDFLDYLKGNGNINLFSIFSKRSNVKIYDDMIEIEPDSIHIENNLKTYLDELDEQIFSFFKKKLKVEIIKKQEIVQDDDVINLVKLFKGNVK